MHTFQSASARLLFLATIFFAPIAAAQPDPRLAAINPPRIEIYPRYPVSYSFAAGPSVFINSARAIVSLLVYSAQCTNAPIVPNDIVATYRDNSIEVGPVYFSFQPVCGFLGDHQMNIAYTVPLRELGPGAYRIAVSGRPGDAPAPATTTTVVTMTEEFVVLDMNQASRALIENPAPGSTQSGIGLISGWACVADSVETSIDGGPRNKAMGNMSREDVRPVCGHRTAGFGNLINFNVLGAGDHTLQLFVKGVPIGPPTQFRVVVPLAEFARGLSRDVLVLDFPVPGKSLSLDWREAEQNFGIKEVK